MRAINARDTLTQREIDEFEQQKEVTEIHAKYQIQLKELDLQVKKIEVKWSQVFRLPLAIVYLPVKIVFGLGYIAHAIKGTQPSDKFWEFLLK